MSKDLNYRCRHFNGIQNDECRAGINYSKDLIEGQGILPLAQETKHLWPCRQAKKISTCGKYEPYTVEELQEQRDSINNLLESLCQNVSPCCKAPLNEKSVIQQGRFKGHGPRYCSKCGQVAFVV